jgi:hypothetical protein
MKRRDQRRSRILKGAAAAVAGAVVLALPAMPSLRRYLRMMRM